MELGRNTEEPFRSAQLFPDRLMDPTWAERSP
jgi:hypothetical protein